MSDDPRDEENKAAAIDRILARKAYRKPLFIRLGTLREMTMSRGNARRDGGSVIRPTFTGRGGRNGGSRQS